MDLAQRAGADHLHDAPVGGAIVVDVVPHLGDALVLERGGDHGAPFADGIGQRLLDKYVLARLAGMDGGEGVPVVGRGHHHGVQVFALQQFAEVVERRGFPPLLLFDYCRGAIEVLAIKIADRGRIDVVLLHEFVEAICSLTAQADETDFPIFWRGGGVGAGWVEKRRQGPAAGRLGGGGFWCCCRRGVCCSYFKNR